MWRDNRPTKAQRKAIKAAKREALHRLALRAGLPL